MFSLALNVTDSLSTRTLLWGIVNSWAYDSGKLPELIWSNSENLGFLELQRRIIDLDNGVRAAESLLVDKIRVDQI